MRIKNTTLAILWPMIFVGSVALAAAGDRYLSNPTLNKDVVIQVNKAGVTTDVIKAVGSTGEFVLGPSTGSVQHTIQAGDIQVSLKSLSGGGNGAVMTFAASGNSQTGIIGVSSAGGFLTDAAQGDMFLRTGNDIRFSTNSGSSSAGKITAAGAWTLGSATSTAKHTIRHGSATANLPVLTIIKDNLSQNTNNNAYISFEAASGQDDGYIQTNGSAVLTLVDVSDVRFKKNIRDATYGLDTILALRPVLFDWKSGPQNVKGFIAQEVKSVLPESVTIADKSQSGGYKDSHFLEVQTMIPVLVKAVQELSAENDRLKFRLKALEDDRGY